MMGCPGQCSPSCAPACQPSCCISDESQLYKGGPAPIAPPPMPHGVMLPPQPEPLCPPTHIYNTQHDETHEWEEAPTVKPPPPPPPPPPPQKINNIQHIIHHHKKPPPPPKPAPPPPPPKHQYQTMHDEDHAWAPIPPPPPIPAPPIPPRAVNKIIHTIVHHHVEPPAPPPPCMPPPCMPQMNCCGK